MHPEISVSGGRSGSRIKEAVVPPNAIVRGGSEDRILISNGEGKIILDITKDRIKHLLPGRGYVKGDGRKEEPTPEIKKLIDIMWGK